MQVTLESDELAYLLHILQANKQIVGLKSNQLFPDDPTNQETILNNGFTKLIEHQWLVTTKNGINTNSQLMLMVAVIASAKTVFTATYYTNTESSQTITYYLAQGLIIEQFITIENRYTLTQLKSIEELKQHIKSAFPTTTNQHRQPISFNLKNFYEAVEQAKSGQPSKLKTILVNQNITDSFLDIIIGLQPFGRIEGASSNGQTLLNHQELVLLHDIQNSDWLIYSDIPSNTIHLIPIFDNQFEQKLSSFITPFIQPNLN